MYRHLAKLKKKETFITLTKFFKQILQIRFFGFFGWVAAPDGSLYVSTNKHTLCSVYPGYDASNVRNVVDVVDVVDVSLIFFS